MRPFRFLATVDEAAGFAELASLARKAEAVGCSAFVLPDHLIGQYAAVPLLAVVAAVTERLRVGTFVLNVCLPSGRAGPGPGRCRRAVWRPCGDRPGRGLEQARARRHRHPGRTGR